uniref:Uncharacterized protein n=1 Tax=Bionectria ochroleuca TaxID=29856 RepID=A0A8H7NKH0_BIOOC
MPGNEISLAPSIRTKIAHQESPYIRYLPRVAANLKTHISLLCAALMNSAERFDLEPWISRALTCEPLPAFSVEDIGRKFAKSDYETLKNLRLVCHLFDQIATLFLLPIIRVQLNQSSLERVQSISRNPRLKSGICGIQLFIGCRFEIHASSKSEFFTHQQRIARQLFDYNALMIRACVVACDRFLGTSPLPALGRLDILHSESPPRLKEQVDESLIDECEEILHGAYEYNKAEYLRDWPVVSEKQLSNALAQLISLQNLPISLSIAEIPLSSNNLIHFWILKKLSTA